MPKLLLFVPCEKLIVDELGNPSLICILQSITLTLQKGAEIPKDAIAPREWDVVTLWEPKEGEEGQKARQVVEVILPDKTVSPIASRIEFQIQKGKTHRNKVHINGFPIGQAGKHDLRLTIEPVAGDVVERQVFTYPLEIKHERE